MRRILDGLVVVVTGTAVWGLAQFLDGYGQLAHRIRGPFSHYMTFSGVLLVADLILIAVQLAAPALIALFLTDVGFGIINRASPQINVFVLSQPAKVGIGVLMVLIVLQVLFAQFELHTRDMLVSFYRFAGYFGR